MKQDSKQSQSSILDIINPIMIGPSSSHTAGAVKIGQIARNIYGKPFKKVLITLYNSYATTGLGHGSDKGLLAGLLGFRVDDKRIKDIFDTLEVSKIEYRFDFKESFTKHPNAVDFLFDDDMLIMAKSVGGGEIEVYNINGFNVSLTGKYNSIIIVVEDTKGTISKITSVIQKNEINIATLNCQRKGRGNEASIVIALDNEIEKSAIDEIKELINPYLIRYVERL